MNPLECCAKHVNNDYVKQRNIINTNMMTTPPGPFDPEDVEVPWFLPPSGADNDDPYPPLPRAASGSLVDAASWRAAEAALAGELSDLSFDLGRLTERVSAAGAGAVRRLALAEASSFSWWLGDHVTSDRLALWLSYRIGAADDAGSGLIRTAWAARRLGSAGQGTDIATVVERSFGDEGRANPGLIADVAAEMAGLAGTSLITQGAALFHLWRSLDERPEHLRGLEAAVLGARLAMARGRALPFLPLTLTGFAALTSSGPAEVRLSGWTTGAHRATLSALLMLERIAEWRARARAETADLSGRIPARLIDALAAHPTLAAQQAETETSASRAAVQRNFDILTQRRLAREITGQGRFRVWAATT